ERQRVDKWLWFSRIVKSRTLASELVSGGKLRVNKLKIGKPSHLVGSGDVLTFTHYGRLRVIKICAIGARRGPAPEAQALYEDLSPPQEKKEDAPSAGDLGQRESGAGRPTKKERRDMERWLKA
ncbi:MAG: RNA-binding S4 domain-containing protein, partial [Pseudomonadota bacterium]